MKGKILECLDKGNVDEALAIFLGLTDQSKQEIFDAIPAGMLEFKSLIIDCDEEFAQKFIEKNGHEPVSIIENPIVIQEDYIPPSNTNVKEKLSLGNPHESEYTNFLKNGDIDLAMSYFLADPDNKVEKILECLKIAGVKAAKSFVDNASLGTKELIYEASLTNNRLADIKVFLEQDAELMKMVNGAVVKIDAPIKASKQLSQEELKELEAKVLKFIAKADKFVDKDIIEFAKDHPYRFPKIIKKARKLEDKTLLNILELLEDRFSNFIVSILTDQIDNNNCVVDPKLMVNGFTHKFLYDKVNEETIKFVEIVIKSNRTLLTNVFHEFQNNPKFKSKIDKAIEEYFTGLCKVGQLKLINNCMKIIDVKVIREILLKDDQRVLKLPLINGHVALFTQLAKMCNVPVRISPEDILEAVLNGHRNSFEYIISRLGEVIASEVRELIIERYNRGNLVNLNILRQGITDDFWETIRHELEPEIDAVVPNFQFRALEAKSKSHVSGMEQG